MKLIKKTDHRRNKTIQGSGESQTQMSLAASQGTLIIEGRIVDISGEPIEGVLLNVWHSEIKHLAESFPKRWGFMKTDEKGRFRFDVMKPSSEEGLHFVFSKQGLKIRYTELFFETPPEKHKHASQIPLMSLVREDDGAQIEGGFFKLSLEKS